MTLAFLNWAGGTDFMLKRSLQCLDLPIHDHVFLKWDFSRRMKAILEVSMSKEIEYPPKYQNSLQNPRKNSEPEP